MMIKFENYNKEKYVNKFLQLYFSAPKSLKDKIDQLKNIKQSKKWHPEGNVYNHIKLVTNRLSNCYNDINLTLAGFFHDLGKIDTTKFNDEKQTWTAYGHEDSSVDILNYYKDWIKELGGNINIIEYIVANHMKIKYLDEFKFKEKINFINHPLFDYVVKFTTADYGGFGLDCKSKIDISDIKNKINQYNKKIKEDKIISSKFNGRLIMELFPELKSKELGDFINLFKSQFDNFREYALNTPKEKILNDFKILYIKKW